MTDDEFVDEARHDRDQSDRQFEHIRCELLLQIGVAVVLDRLTTVAAGGGGGGVDIVGSGGTGSGRCRTRRIT